MEPVTGDDRAEVDSNADLDENDSVRKAKDEITADNFGTGSKSYLLIRHRSIVNETAVRRNQSLVTMSEQFVIFSSRRITNGCRYFHSTTIPLCEPVAAPDEHNISHFTATTSTLTPPHSTATKCGGDDEELANLQFENETCLRSVGEGAPDSERVRRGWVGWEERHAESSNLEKTMFWDGQPRSSTNPPFVTRNVLHSLSEIERKEVSEREKSVERDG
ncbi:hypothetical protein BLNAU_17555 [Blattamonas nauphoetae]|uniref:Uncharacterized protein n=1 Tax=Blattamonas nauphoetae TaxID=2049346 RepID=A0ABQ9X8L1_9EUKA|nr:hypothetical protein BLNAU_17555 [Blattamonas nauphoetae]